MNEIVWYLERASKYEGGNEWEYKRNKISHKFIIVKPGDGYISVHYITLSFTYLKFYTLKR